MPEIHHAKVMDDGYSDMQVARAEALSALVQRVGYAVWQCAECEDTLTHWVIVALRPTRGIGEAAATTIIDTVQRRTFGQLFAELERSGLIDPPLLDRLRALRDQRNWLVHHAKRENRGVLNDLANFESLIKKLDWIAEEATDLNSTLAHMFEEFIVKKGVDRAEIDREADRLRREWGY